MFKLLYTENTEVQNIYYLHNVRKFGHFSSDILCWRQYCNNNNNKVPFSDSFKTFNINKK